MWKLKLSYLKSLAEAEEWFSFPNSEEKKSFKKMSLGMDCGGELE